MLLGLLRRQQDLFDRYRAVQKLIVAAPYPSHATLANPFNQQIPSANQNPRPTRHSTIISQELAGNANKRNSQTQGLQLMTAWCSPALVGALGPAV
jgi:hypothetical protein